MFFYLDNFRCTRKYVFLFVLAGLHYERSIEKRGRQFRHAYRFFSAAYNLRANCPAQKKIMSLIVLASADLGGIGKCDADDFF